METKYIQLKNLIKEKEALQRALKNHRKTVNFKGEERMKVTLTRNKNDYTTVKETVTEVQKGFLGRTKTVQKVINKAVVDPSLATIEVEVSPTLALIMLGQYGWDGTYTVYDKDGKRVGKYDVENNTAVLNRLYAIYGILRNERKTKKVERWIGLEDYYAEEVNKWRDEETVCVNK